MTGSADPRERTLVDDSSAGTGAPVDPMRCIYRIGSMTAASPKGTLALLLLSKRVMRLKRRRGREAQIACWLHSVAGAGVFGM